MSNNPLVLQPIDGEPRIRDLDLAVRLGFERPAKIREIIKRNLEKLNTFNVIPTVGRCVELGNGAKRDVEEYYLDRKQAAFICMKSETDNAFEVQVEIIEVFDAYQNGTLEPKKPLSLAEQCLLSAQVICEHDRRLATIESTVATIQAALPQPSTHATVKSYAISKGYQIDNKLASQLGRKCAMLCRQAGMPMPLVADEQFSAVNSYPLNVLKLAFDEIMPDGVPKQKYVLEPEGDCYPVKELGYAVGMKRVNERGMNSYLDYHLGWQYYGPDGRWHPTDKGKPHCKVASNGKLLWNIEAFKAEYRKHTSAPLAKAA